MIKLPCIVVWTAVPDDVPPAAWPHLLRLLSDAERACAARFAFERHRRLHIAAHALKRLVLSAHSPVGASPRSLRFEVALGGKPRLWGRAEPHFNLSHAEGLVACAVSKAGALGVDVERLCDAAVHGLAASCLAPSEQTWLRGLPPTQEPVGFLRLWTLKEAYLKAVGIGVAQPMRDIAFSFDPLRVRFLATGLGDRTAWRFDQRVLGASHLLALAWQGRDMSVEIRAVDLGAWVQAGSARDVIEQIAANPAHHDFH